MRRSRRILTILLLSLSLVAGCGYGEVSPTTYELAKSLYNISNRRLPGKLATAKAKIATAREDGDISKKEAQWLNTIIAQAEQDNWQRAMKSARRMMEDQVSR